MKKEYHIIQSRYLRHVHTYRAARTYKSCSPKNNRSNKKKTLFFFKNEWRAFFKKPPDLFTAIGNLPYSIEVSPLQTHFCKEKA
mgnify:CR=1 FL=1